MLIRARSSLLEQHSLFFSAPATDLSVSASPRPMRSDSPQEPIDAEQPGNASNRTLQ
jgi:hypothetical protein